MIDSSTYFRIFRRLFIEDFKEAAQIFAENYHEDIKLEFADEAVAL